MRLIDADALREKLIALNYHTRADNMNEACVRAVDYAPTVGGWISVKERMPEHVDRVPVLYRFTDSELQDGKLHTAMLWYVIEPFCGDEPPHWERVGRYEYEVLYWFELPGAPEEVQG